MKITEKTELLNNIDRLKTTINGAIRVRNNLGLNSVNVVEWCKNLIMNKNAKVRKEGKNYYVQANSYEITINSSSFTIITAHLL